jgi:hypothetical protein
MMHPAEPTPVRLHEAGGLDIAELKSVSLPPERALPDDGGSGNPGGRDGAAGF